MGQALYSWCRHMMVMCLKDTLYVYVNVLHICNLITFQGHCLQDLPSGVWDMTPNIVTHFLPRIFHVPDQNSIIFLVEICPSNSRNLVLPTCREHREADYLDHVDRGWSHLLSSTEMLQNLFQFSFCRPS